MNTPTVLPASLLSQVTGPVATRTGPPFLGTALMRSLLLLVPVPLAAAAAGAIATLPWTVPVAALVAGWCAAQPLTHLGQLTAGRRGPVPAARLVLAGFAALAAAWSVGLAVAPQAVIGADRAAAYAVSLPALGLLAVVAVALAVRCEAMLLRWTVPALLIAAAWLLDLVPERAAAALLLATVALPLLRAGAIAARRADGPAGRWRGRELVWAAWYLLLGACQAALVVTVWQAGTTAAAVAVPLLVAVPLAEVWIGWHLARAVAGRAAYDDREPYLRHVRRLGWATLSPLLPPLVAGVALAASASRLPYGLSAHPDAPAAVLSMAAGVLLPGVVALGLLLAAVGRPGLAALVTGGPVAGALAWHAGAPGLTAGSLSGWGQLLPTVATALLVGYAVGLVLATHVLVDPRRRR